MLSFVVICGLAVAAVAALNPSSPASPRAHGPFVQQCSSTDANPRNPANALDTPNFTGSDPLGRAHLFVESPWLLGGDAANAIANEVGLGYLARQESGQPLPWAKFKKRVNSMHLPRLTSFRVHELEKIGNYPQAHQFSVYTAGGSGEAIYRQVQNYLCRMQRTDPAAAAVITTYFINDNSGCGGGGYQPNFFAEVDALKAAVGRFRALIFVEEDGVDTLCWSSRASVSGRRC